MARRSNVYPFSGAQQRFAMYMTRYFAPPLVAIGEADFNRLATRGWLPAEASRYRARLAVWESEGGAVVKQRDRAATLEAQNRVAHEVA